MPGPGVHWHCQGTQPHSTRFTTRAFHSNLICISCILVEGGRDISELRCLTRCRWCAPARCRQRLATRLLLASRLLGMSCFGSSLTARPLPAWSPFPLFLSSPLSAATGPMPVVSGVPSPRGFGAAVIAAPGKTQIPQQQIWGKLDAEEYVRFRGYDYQWRVHAGTTLLRAGI